MDMDWIGIHGNRMDMDTGPAGSGYGAPESTVTVDTTFLKGQSYADQ